MYKLFLDETGDHSLRVVDAQYPIFILVGCLFEAKYYDGCVIPRINKLKKKHFKSDGVILHSYEIRKRKGPFCFLNDVQMKDAFHKDLNALIGSLSFRLIATVILKNELNKIKHKLKHISKDPYEICFEFIQERFVSFLKLYNETGEMSFESRDDCSNNKLHTLYDVFRANGSSNLPPIEIKKRILGISFPNKRANLVGHQIADLVAHPIARYILSPEKENKLYNILLLKFLRGPNKKIEDYGLKVFPKKDFIPKRIEGPKNN